MKPVFIVLSKPPGKPTVMSLAGTLSSGAPNFAQSSIRAWSSEPCSATRVNLPGTGRYFTASSNRAKIL